MWNMDLQGTPLFTIENKIIKGRKLFYSQIQKQLGEIILDNLKKNPEFIGQIDAKTGESCTYKKLAEESIRCAIWLKNQGIKAGDVVAICTNNNIPLWAPFCAVCYVGANLNPWYHDWSADTVRYFMNLTKPKVIFANEKAAGMLKKIIREEKVNTKLVIFGKVNGLESFDDIIKKQSSEEVENFVCRTASLKDECLVLFSSGSTGLPKGVQYTNEGVYYIYYRFNAQFTKTEGLASTNPSSLYWISAVLQMMRCLLTVSPAIILSDPTPEELCRAIEKYKIRWLFSGTGMLNDLSQSQILNKYDLSSVQTLVFGGSKLRLEVMKIINKAFVNATMNQVYGFSELGISTMQLGDEKKNINYDSCGVVLFDVELKVVDVNTGEILGPQQEGELYFKQKGMMKCYFQNPKATEEAFDSDGWFHSGDLGYYDEKGYVYFVDRIKEIIKYRGHQVAPLEIETILLKHPEILEAAVVAVPHALDDEHPFAFVIKSQNSEVTKQELLKLTSCLGDTKKLRGGIEFLEKLPKTPTGKIEKKKLKEMAKSYMQ